MFGRGFAVAEVWLKLSVMDAFRLRLQDELNWEPGCVRFGPAFALKFPQHMSHAAFGDFEFQLPRTVFVHDLEQKITAAQRFDA